jgi:hypothetical protein
LPLEHRDDYEGVVVNVPELKREENQRTFTKTRSGGLWKRGRSGKKKPNESYQTQKHEKTKII